MVGCEDQAIWNNEQEIPETSEIYSKTDSSGLVISEICHSSRSENEFGKKSDWIELYNTSDSSIIIEDKSWYLTDDVADSEKFELPKQTMAPHSFLIIWCDGKDTVNREIHANFKLSSKGESLRLIHSGEIVDELTFKKSKGNFIGLYRSLDNLNEWRYCSKNSRGRAND